MKRITSIMLMILSLIFFVSCSNDKMYIEPARLTNDEKNILSLLDNKNKIYDFTLGKDGKSYNILIQKLENDEWVELSSSESNYDYSKARLYLDFTIIPNDICFNVQDTEGLTSVSRSTSNKAPLPEGRATAFLKSRIDYNYNENIPIVVQAFTNDVKASEFTVMDYYSPKNFEELGYTEVYAIVLNVSNNELS